MLSKSNLPLDIKKYVKKTVVKRILKCCILLIILSVLGNILFRNTVENIKITCYLLLLVSAFLISGVPVKLIGRTWSGKITNVVIKSVTGTYSIGGRPWPYTKNIIVLTLQKENGRIMFKEIKSLGVKEKKGLPRYTEGVIENHIDDYKVGDVIWYIYGLPYPIIVPADERTNTINYCAICGNKNPINNDYCFNCGYSLIKATNFKKEKRYD